MDSVSVVTKSPQATSRWGEIIAGRLRPGDVISIIGDLGAGKTVFVKGLAAGLGIDPVEVTSPTFALINEYTATVPLYHFDAYRINRPGEWEDLGYEEYFRGQGISAVEWGNLVEDYLPATYLQIAIEQTAAGGTHRRLTIGAVGHGHTGLMTWLKGEIRRAHHGD